LTNPQTYIQLTDGYLVIDSCELPTSSTTRGIQINIGGQTQLIVPSNASFPGNGNQLLGIHNDGSIYLTSASGVFSAGGDLSGSASSQTVIGLQGHPISSTSPTTKYVLTWNGSAWTPEAAAVGFSAGGDLCQCIRNSN
jgi:hypothetical protein